MSIEKCYSLIVYSSTQETSVPSFMHDRVKHRHKSVLYVLITVVSKGVCPMQTKNTIVGKERTSTVIRSLNE